MVENCTKCGNKLKKGVKFCTSCGFKVEEMKEEHANFRTEIADMFEALHTLMDVKEITIEEVEKIREEKREQKGGYEKRIFLEDIQ